MTKVTSSKLKIFVYAVDGVGHLAACVGVCQPLAKRGHSVYFLINEAFAGQYSKFGFSEILLTQAAKAQPDSNQKKQTEAKNPVKEMAELLKESGFLGPKSTLEKLRDQINDSKKFMDTIYDQLVEYNPQIEDAIKKESPDLFIVDTFLMPPAVRTSGIPYACLFSPNPLFIFKSAKLPPFGSGFAADSDPEGWKEFNTLLRKDWDENYLEYQLKLNAHFNFEPNDPVYPSHGLPVPLSPFLNIYGFPAELDYTDIAPCPENVVAVDTFCRESPDSFELPEHFARKQGEKLIYVSLGSMGSIDVELMKRITSVLGKTPHKYIVSKGQCGDEYELPANCWGQNFLPQTKILPLVDLVITHGGNNTITEAFSFGKLMIVMQLFGDQADNAQRVHEKGYGIRVEPYTFTDDELIGAIEKLLNDKEMQARADKAAQRIAKAKSKEKLADRIEEMVAKFKAN